MHSRLVAIKCAYLCFLVLASLAGLVFAADRGAPSVRAVLFYGPDCPQCSELFGYFLPGLFERYGDRLEIAGVDVGKDGGATVYRAAAERYDLPPQWPGVPVIVAGERSMIGLVAIGESLGDGFEKVARSPGASSWPPITGLAPLLPMAVTELRARVTREGVLPTPRAVAGHLTGNRTSDKDRIANALAVVVLVGMALALIHSLVRVWRKGGLSRDTPFWLLLVVILIGLGVSGYTAYTALADVAPICGPIGGCESVQHSEYAKLFGIPMGVLGLFGYGAILVTWLIGRRVSPHGGGWRWLPWAITLFGVLFSLRLTALEPFVIGATCLWCLGSAVSITITLWLLSGETRSRSESSGEAALTVRG